MSMRELLSEIERYCAERPMSVTAFGRAAVSDPGFVARIRNGGECLPRTVQKVRDFMATTAAKDDAA